MDLILRHPKLNNGDDMDLILRHLKLNNGDHTDLILRRPKVKQRGWHRPNITSPALNELSNDRLTTWASIQ